jgi:UDP-N-acetylmuramyl pentapeptide phosphotransferase/UDP-N-acetylglucosamine-1-phosphate transferase
VEMQPVLVFLLVLGAGAALAAAVAVRGVEAWLCRREILAHPNERSSHSIPTPSGGGLAVVGVVFLGVLLTGFLSNAVLGSAGSFLKWWPFAAAALGVAAVGWLDDLRNLPQVLRLTVHAIAAVTVILVFGAMRSLWLPAAGPVALGGLAGPLAFLWLVGLTNAYNFMDGIDGIAGCQAVAAGLGWSILGALRGEPEIVALALLLAGANLGFLTRNWPPAKVFMGDVGSTFLGFAFAALPLLADPADPRLFLAGVLLVWPFAFDASFTVVRRLLRGENILRAHRTHLYQRLVITGWSHRAVTVLYTGLAVVGGLLAVAYTQGWIGADWAAVVAPPILFAGLWCLVRAREKVNGGNGESVNR